MTKGKKKMKRIMIYWSIIIALVGLCLLSCMSANKHFEKFQKKGGKVNCIADTIQVIDTLIINGDTVFYFRPEIVVKDSIHYVTKWETKYKYKTVKEQEKTARNENNNETKQVKQQEKTERTEIKQENKTERAKLKWWMWFSIGFFSCLLFLIALYLVFYFTVARKI